MPTYVYGCDACGHRFEKFQKFADEPVRICPACQSSVRRIMQPAGIVFKGSGWHITDYKRNGSDGGAAAKDGAPAKDGTSGAAKDGTASNGAAETPGKSEPAKSAASDTSSAAQAA